MKLQFAIDTLDEKKALDAAARVYEWFDVIEIGTSLLKYAGIGIVDKIKATCPGKPIFLDSKIIDGPTIEAALMCQSGASMFSMLGCATDQAVSTVLEMASRHHIEVVFDMQSIADPAGRSARLKALGAQQLCVHKSTGCGENLISSFREYLDIQRLTQLPMAVAGGITLDSFYQIKAVLAPTTTIIGHAVQDAEDNMEAIAQQFRLLADQ